LRSEAALRESEERFRLVAENAPVMLWMGDENGKCLYLNRPSRGFWGVDGAALADFDWSRTPPCCTDRRYGGSSPVVDAAHAVRTYSGRPSFSIRLSARAAMATSVARRSSVRDHRPPLRTRFQRDTSASTRARQL